MRRQVYILILLVLILSTFKAAAHEDVPVIRNFGKVKVKITTGFSYEEVQNAFIIGELANKLSNKLNCTESIFIDLHHYYVEDITPRFFLAFDYGGIKHKTDGQLIQRDDLGGKSIILRAVAKHFDAVSILKLLEYSIRNLEDIKGLQHQTHYSWWNINSVGKDVIQGVLDFNPSKQLQKILNKKIERPYSGIESHISYYWKANKYYLYTGRAKKLPVLELSSIYGYHVIDTFSVIVFDTDSSFYYIHEKDYSRISDRIVIHGIEANYKPFEVEKRTDEECSISFWDAPLSPYDPEKRRVFVFYRNKDALFEETKESR